MSLNIENHQPMSRRQLFRRSAEKAVKVAVYTGAGAGAASYLGIWGELIFNSSWGRSVRRGVNRFLDQHNPLSEYHQLSQPRIPNAILQGSVFLTVTTDESGQGAALRTEPRVVDPSNDVHNLVRPLDVQRLGSVSDPELQWPQWGYIFGDSSTIRLNITNPTLVNGFNADTGANDGSGKWIMIPLVTKNDATGREVQTAGYVSLSNNTAGYVIQSSGSRIVGIEGQSDGAYVLAGQDVIQVRNTNQISISQ